MEYKRFGNTLVLRLDKNDEITSAVLTVAKQENIKLASVSGIGATDNVTVGVFDVEKKAYDKFTFTGNHEITSLVGNINTMNGESYCHLHITLAGPDGIVKGGHLLSAVVSLTSEIFFSITDGIVDRKRNENLGINTFYFRLRKNCK